MNVDELRHNLRRTADGELRRLAFDVLRDIAALSADPPLGMESQELIIRCLDRQDVFESYRPLLNALVRQHGLFPYLLRDELTFTDLVAYETNRPAAYDDERFVFHRVQGEIYRR